MPGVPLMYVARRRYQIERLPEYVPFPSGFEGFARVRWLTGDWWLFPVAERRTHSDPPDVEFRAFPAEFLSWLSALHPSSLVS